MNIVQLEPVWDDLIDREWIDELDATAFLTHCREGRIELDELQTFVVQHHFYARHFTRYLCALLANLVNEAERLELAENLFDELGLGDLGGVPHSQMYREMMRKLGVGSSVQPVLPSTQVLIDCMLASCRNEDPLVGLGALCLGAEAIVPHLYSQIVRGAEALGIPAATLDFFTVHIAGDDAHALTMRRIIESAIAADGAKRKVLRDSARQAIKARKLFFDGLGLAAVQLTQQAQQNGAGATGRKAHDVLQLQGF